MIETFTIERAAAIEDAEGGYQQLIPWSRQVGEPPIGAMACFLGPGQASLPDRHDQDEVVIVLTGLAEVRLDHDVARLSDGQMAVLPRNLTHVVTNAACDRELVWVSLYWPLHEPGDEPGDEAASDG
ncbi:MAG: cupin domain-containing protein [Candidatus Dormibacteraeota bacterium]|nr:cupin domain-containing protein [Candidatus Dormibacteraeota bacterium]